MNRVRKIYKDYKAKNSDRIYVMSNKSYCNRVIEVLKGQVYKQVTTSKLTNVYLKIKPLLVMETDFRNRFCGNICHGMFFTRRL
jgi:hypothetical protein